MREKIYNFFENPKGFWAFAVQGLIMVLILLSVWLVAVEFFNRPYYLKYETDFQVANYLILFAFTIEYLLRLFTAPSKKKFVIKPLNIVDFFAIAPNYLEFVLPFFIETTELRVLRLLRLLRLSRSLRLFMLVRYKSAFKKVLKYKGTILESISPILILLAVLKIIFWVLEVRGLWVRDTNLNELLSIIGFSLGIILAEKIEMTHNKFLMVENATVELYATLTIIKHLVDRLHPGRGTKLVKEWTKEFLKLLHDPKADNFLINVSNEKVYKQIAEIEPKVADVHNYYLKLLEDSSFCLSKKEHLTPRAYDTLLHQATLLYLALIAVFIPGFTGLISVIVATYVLYGMYYLTQDMDTIIGGEYNLINIRTSQLEHLAEN
ncbi:MAG: ion transporter [Candidatus Levyibacteriota bacterium]